MSLRVGLVGAGARGRARAAALAGAEGVTLVGIADQQPERAEALAERHGARAFRSVAELIQAVDALCVAVPAMDHFLIARTAAREGRHVFLEWPPATSVAECERLAAVAEEAGVEIGVSSPLRFHPLIDALPDAWAPTLIDLRYDVGVSTGPALFRWPHVLGAALDLCARLAGSEAVLRVDAAAVRTGTLLDAMALTLRYHRGTFAHVRLRRLAPAPARTLYLAGDGRHVDADLDAGSASRYRLPPHAAAPQAESMALEPGDLLDRELDAFLQAVAAGRHVPVGALEALHTMQLVERIRARLR